ncbi:MAG: GntR family transcriptional regulator [Planctomycetes bacterium]|nr:GntR family transcriptional regulator [Planctomycetota bacterium]MCB9890903.1 GntR family transcriptional regulator [Planctomycetota bacterium]
MPTPEEPHTVSEKAYRYLRARMMDGRLRPGSKLITRSIAREVGGSLNPVREAIGRLAAEGLVEHIPGAGAKVRTLSRREIVELYGVRQAIEPYAAMEAARLIDEAELHELEEVCAEFSRMARRIRETNTLPSSEAEHWLHCTIRFHQVLVDAARNRFLSRIITDMQVLTRIFHAHVQARAVPTLAQAASTWRTHVKLVRLLRRRESEATRDHVRYQLQLGLRHTLSILSKRTSS